MGPEPVAKCDHKRRLGDKIRNRFGRANPASNEMMLKELHSELGVIADLSALEMRASATAKVTAKGLKRGEIDVLQHTPFPLNEAAEMDGGSKVSNCACRCVSLAFEVIGERVDGWSSDSTAQPSKRLGRGEVRFSHGLSLLSIGHGWPHQRSRSTLRLW